MFFPILFFISSTSLEQQCSERQKYELAKTAEKCFQKFFSQIDLSNACTQTNCETNLSKCHNPDYIGSMRKYFHEKAIYYKWWLILSKKLLGDPLSESVFYFFSPFLLQYCSEAGRISSGQEYFNECMHVKAITRKWPLHKMGFSACPSVSFYLKMKRNSWRRTQKLLGPVWECRSNQEFNFCFQDKMNRFPSRAMAGWEEGCLSLQEIYEDCPAFLQPCLYKADYRRFVEELLNNLLATMSLIEGVCPLSHTGASLTACPVFGEKADHASELIVLNKNILENINLTDRFHQLHESSIEVKLSDLEQQHSHYHHAPAPTTERETSRLILSLITEGTNFELETEANTFQTYLPDTTSQSPESETFGLVEGTSETNEYDTETEVVLQNNRSEGLSLVGTMLVGNLNGSDLISTTCSSSSTANLTVYIVSGVVIVLIILLLLVLWMFFTRWHKGGKKAHQRTMQQRALKRPSRGAESFL